MTPNGNIQELWGRSFWGQLFQAWSSLNLKTRCDLEPSVLIWGYPRHQFIHLFISFQDSSSTLIQRTDGSSDLATTSSDIIQWSLTSFLTSSLPHFLTSSLPHGSSSCRVSFLLRALKHFKVKVPPLLLVTLASTSLVRILAVDWDICLVNLVNSVEI